MKNKGKRKINSFNLQKEAKNNEKAAYENVVAIYVRRNQCSFFTFDLLTRIFTTPVAATIDGMRETE